MFFRAVLVIDSINPTKRVRVRLVVFPFERICINIEYTGARCVESESRDKHDRIFNNPRGNCALAVCLFIYLLTEAILREKYHLIFRSTR